MRVVALVSGGKDSCYCMMKCVASGHQIVALANLQPNPGGGDELDSYMFQTVGHEGIHLYAEAMSLPLYQVTTKGISVTKEMTYDPKDGDEVEDLYELLQRVKEETVGGVEGVASGAILSDYQRIRVENVCTRLGLVSLAYLWRRDQKELLREMVENDIEALVIKVAALGLTEKHLGMTIADLYPEICSLSERYGLNVCGEGGEYETFTLDCPLFKKKIVLCDSEVVVHSDDAFAPVAFLRMTKFQLQEKEASRCGLAMTGSEQAYKDTVTSDLKCTHEFLSAEAQCVSTNTGNVVVVVRNGDTGFHTVQNQTEELFECVGKTLEKLECSWGDVVMVYLYLNTMADYPVVNQVYVKFFSVNPPARVCVSVGLPEGVHLQVEMLLALDKHREEGVASRRSCMHVQSHSEWAPANIGPYSQACTVGEVVLGAGQIGLDPCHMAMVLPIQQAALSLSHTQSVLKACHASLTSALCGTCYYTTEEAGWQARRALMEAGAEEAIDCPVSFLRVPGLPRGACVEWHFIAAKVSTDVTYSSHQKHDGVLGMLTLQESWCSELRLGCWLANAQSPLHCQGQEDERSLKSYLSRCFQQISSELLKHDLSFQQMTLLRVCVPRYGSSRALNLKDVQECVVSTSGQSAEDKVAVSVVHSEDYWNHNGSVFVLALRIL